MQQLISAHKSEGNTSMPRSYLLLLLRMQMQRISTAHLIGHGNLIATLNMLLVLMGNKGSGAATTDVRMLNDCNARTANG